MNFMTFAEKLRAVSEGVNKARAGKAAGMRSTTISNYIATRSIPRADIALKLARALGVSLEWLVDDAQGMPPVRDDTETPLARTVLTAAFLAHMAASMRHAADAVDSLAAPQKKDHNA
jgi:transcriptional regulator with XRE-family HTH domain